MLHDGQEINPQENYVRGAVTISGDVEYIRNVLSSPFYKDCTAFRPFKSGVDKKYPGMYCRLTSSKAVYKCLGFTKGGAGYYLDICGAFTGNMSVHSEDVILLYPKSIQLSKRNYYNQIDKYLPHTILYVKSDKLYLTEVLDYDFKISKGIGVYAERSDLQIGDLTRLILKRYKLPEKLVCTS